ncbi:glycosyltransferase family 87 protein [Streptomyces sp. AcH 505]|uniref:glycosyltransferase 87 family protein n=1 Tax=Streptomyces sp. AcH 505 TaxID=352211 RepID=UPI000A5563C4
MTNRRTGTTGIPVPVSVAPPPGFGPLLTVGFDGRPPAAGARPWLALGGVWAVTRAAMAVLLVQDDLGGGGVSAEVYDLYRGWYGQLSHGAFPSGDASWQYPPGAGAVLLSPALLPWFTYFQAFVALTLLADAVVTCALARAGRGSGSPLDGAWADQAGAGAGAAGAWLWVCGLPLLLHIPLARYDVQVTALAVLALLAQRRRPRLGGTLAGIGALAKVWPVLTLLGTAPGRTTRAVWTSAAVSAGALFAVLALFFSHPLDFLRQQDGRGVQIESVGGTALSLAKLAGWSGTVSYRYGAFEFTGPQVPDVARAALLLTALAFCWLLLWRVRAARWTAATPFDAALTAVLLFTVTSRVISPQYLIWLLGLAAVCLTSRHTTQRPVALLLLPASALSALAFPLLYGDVMAVTPLGCAVVATRNALLLAATALSCRRLWAGGRPRKELGLHLR